MYVLDKFRHYDISRPQDMDLNFLDKKCNSWRVGEIVNNLNLYLVHLMVLTECNAEMVCYCTEIVDCCLNFSYVCFHDYYFLFGTYANKVTMQEKLKYYERMNYLYKDTNMSSLHICHMFFNIVNMYCL